MTNEVTKVARPMDKLKTVLSAESVKQQFENALKENAGAFIASIIDLYGSDKDLQECDPSAVVMEALKAATLKLPINKQLGFAYIVPYKGKPQFQLGYKGYIQLAMRTGQYRHLNTGIVYEGMKVTRNILTGEITISGEPTSEKPQGYFAYMELLNGFSKTVYMTREEIIAHAKRYSRSYGTAGSAWNSNFDEMALKTVVRQLLSKYGILSTDMVTALTSTREEEDIEAEVEREVAANANQEVIDVQGEVHEVQTPPIEQDGPGF
ncbi:recombinase RecT [Thermoanaerobacterium sp. DL9XJH110]|uniref:recombinase RecT n=1 Tax=Thermoanaerobacterium sp. DL9XJH110 TaxID=3386643 RepID=UPI003BB811C4